MLNLRSGAAVGGSISHRNEQQTLLYSCIRDSKSSSQMEVLKVGTPSVPMEDGPGFSYGKKKTYSI